MLLHNHVFLFHIQQKLEESISARWNGFKITDLRLIEVKICIHGIYLRKKW